MIGSMRRPKAGASEKIANPFRRFSVWFLGILDFVVYSFVGLAFVFAAALALLFSVSDILHNFGWTPEIKGFALDVLGFVSDLLLVLIIMEVLGTVRSYLEKGDTSVKPFLFIGIISATRGILSIGAHLSIAVGTQTPDEFNHSMIELVVNGFIVIALGVTLKVMGDAATNKEDEAPHPPGPEKSEVVERVVVETSISPHTHLE